MWMPVAASRFFEMAQAIGASEQFEATVG